MEPGAWVGEVVIKGWVILGIGWALVWFAALPLIIVQIVRRLDRVVEILNRQEREG